MKFLSTLRQAFDGFISIADSWSETPCMCAVCNLAQSVCLSGLARYSSRGWWRAEFGGEQGTLLVQQQQEQQQSCVLSTTCSPPAAAPPPLLPNYLPALLLFQCCCPLCLLRRCCYFCTTFWPFLKTNRAKSLGRACTG